MRSRTAASPAAAVGVGTPIAWPFRAWLWVEVLFGLSAIATLVLRPEETATRFAWDIQPVVTAAVLGGLYLATAPLLAAVALARRWEMVRVVILPAVAFTSAELVATLLHLDRFSVGTAPFAVWLASYVLPPPIFLAMYWYHRRRSGPAPVGEPLPSRLRTALFAVGAFLAVDALVGFVVPSWFTGSFPWTLTPLTARVLCGWLLSVGLLMVSMARENDRVRVRLATPQLVLILPVAAVQVARFSGQVDPGHPRLWVAAAIFAFVTAAGAYLARGDWRASLR